MRLVRLTAAAAALALLGGCTLLPQDTTPDTPASPTDQSANPTPSDQAPTGSPTDFGSANASTTAVMAEVTAGATCNTFVSSDCDALVNSTVTTTLRSVEVIDSITVIRFAVRWDKSDAPAEAAASVQSVGLDPTTLMAIDPQELIGYRPLCSQGAWHGGAAQQADCRDSALVSPSISNTGLALPNHLTIEGYAILPAPTGRPATLDIVLAGPAPTFTDATVTYR
jgi:hypothetical protein